MKYEFTNVEMHRAIYEVCHHLSNLQEEMNGEQSTVTDDVKKLVLPEFDNIIDRLEKLEVKVRKSM